MPGLFSSVCSCLFTVVLCCDLLALHLAGVTFMTFFLSVLAGISGLLASLAPCLEYMK